jgi:hypothetical protein
MVRLGKDTPSWELNRWGRDVLRFSSLSGGGYALRGDSRHLLYRGEKESHRFTILDNERFEYDIILKKEPASNKIYIGIDGWEGFDFFRQPDTLSNPLLAGSYAVYKKETITDPRFSTGTGKICHIHRPEIIDARGRRVWGDVWIDRGIMTITIPERWLGEAKYPVVVDPVIGLTTKGVLGPEDESDTDQSYFAWDDYVGLDFIYKMGVNQYTAPSAVQGNCTAYLYLDYQPGYNCYMPSEYQIWPLAYSNNTLNRPDILLSTQAGYINANIDGPLNGGPRGWRNTTITIGETIPGGGLFWFGFAGRDVMPRYDFGGKFYKSHYSSRYNTYEQVKSKYNKFPFENDTEWIDDYTEVEVWEQPCYAVKMSMYLVYTAVPQNYTRLITQGVRLTDVRSNKYGGIRTIQQNATIQQVSTRLHSTIRTIQHNVTLQEISTRIHAAVRAIQHSVIIQEVSERIYSTMRVITHGAEATGETSHVSDYYRKQSDTAYTKAVSLRHLLIYICLSTAFHVRDFILGRFIKSNEELVIKSPVCREIEIESRIH